MDHALLYDVDSGFFFQFDVQFGCFAQRSPNDLATFIFL